MKLIPLLFLLITSWCFSQQRLGLDISYRQVGLNASVSYHKVFADNWLFSGSLTYGKKGRYIVDYRDDNQNKSDFISPWNEVNQLILEENAKYEIKRYTVKNKALSAQIGLGYFHSFNVTHGVRGHVFLQYGQAFNQVTGTYYSDDQAYDIMKETNTIHSIAAVSAEIYHTIQIWRKFTFYYGLKTPYYLKVDKSRFNPVRKENNFFGLEPEISIGLTYLIGDC
jgi:hypothetical protein